MAGVAAAHSNPRPIISRRGHDCTDDTRSRRCHIAAKKQQETRQPENAVLWPSHQPPPWPAFSVFFPGADCGAVCRHRCTFCPQAPKSGGAYPAGDAACTERDRARALVRACRLEGVRHAFVRCGGCCTECSLREGSDTSWGVRWAKSACNNSESPWDQTPCSQTGRRPIIRWHCEGLGRGDVSMHIDFHPYKHMMCERSLAGERVDNRIAVVQRLPVGLESVIG